MKRIISALICIKVMCVPLLYAMEVIELEDISNVSSIHHYESLSEDIFNDIEEQKQALYGSITDYNTLLTSSSLHQMSQCFYALSDDSKRIVINNMPACLFKSKNLSLLLSAMMLLPPEVIQYVCLHMLDGEKDASEQFYVLPFVQALDRYYQIKIGLADDAKPVGPLYLKPEQVCDLALLRMHEKPWYLPISFVSFDDNKEINSLDETTKNLYLAGKELFVLPEGDGYTLCTKNNLYSIALASGIGLCAFSLGSGIGATVGALSSGVGSVLCNPAFVVINGVASCVLGISASYGCSCITGNGVHRYQRIRI